MHRVKISRVAEAFSRLFPSPFPLPFRRSNVSLQVKNSDPITRVQAEGSAEVLVEMDRVKDAPLRRVTFDGRYG